MRAGYMVIIACHFKLLISHHLLELLQPFITVDAIKSIQVLVYTEQLSIFVILS